MVDLMFLPTEFPFSCNGSRGHAIFSVLIYKHAVFFLLYCYYFSNNGNYSFAAFYLICSHILSPTEVCRLVNFLINLGALLFDQDSHCLALSYALS